MTRVALLLGLMVAAGPTEAATLRDWVDRTVCARNPNADRCRPPAPPEPVQAPVVAPPPVFVPVQPPPQVTPVAPPVAAPVVVRPAPPKRVKTKAVKVKPVKKLKAPPKSKWKAKPRASAANEPGPDLPWPCWMVRLNAGSKSCAALAAEGRRRGITLTRKQHYQAAVCIGRCFPPR